MTEQRITYGDWTIYYDPPPIPVRNCDWHFVHGNHDASWEGEEDGYVSNGLSGSAASIEACKREIADIEEDQGMPLTWKALKLPAITTAVSNFARCLAPVHDGSARGCGCRDIAQRLIDRSALPLPTAPEQDA